MLEQKDAWLICPWQKSRKQLKQENKPYNKVKQIDEVLKNIMDPLPGQGSNLNFSLPLRWLEKVSSTYNVIGRYNHTLSLDATTMVSKNCPTIGEHVVTIFVTLGYHSNSITC